MCQTISSLAGSLGITDTRSNGTPQPRSIGGVRSAAGVRPTRCTAAGRGNRHSRADENVPAGAFRGSKHVRAHKSTCDAVVRGGFAHTQQERPANGGRGLSMGVGWQE